MKITRKRVKKIFSKGSIHRVLLQKTKEIRRIVSPSLGLNNDL